MKIYISGKITGVPGYREHFSRAYNAIMTRWPDAQIFNPIDIIYSLPNTLEYEEIMDFCMYALGNDMIIIREE